MSARGWAAFRSRDFRLFCAARFFVSLATQMQTVAVGWLIYESTRSAFALGFVGLASFLPTVALVLVAGHAADRYDRRRILLLAYSVMGLSAFGLLVHVRTGAEDVWPVYFLLVGFGAARAFANPTGHALVPNLVPSEHLGNAVA